jgi:putative NADH-flavin reductase
MRVLVWLGLKLSQNLLASGLTDDPMPTEGFFPQSGPSIGVCGRTDEAREVVAEDLMEGKMKLTVFAATGGIGRQILEQAVAAGHDVTAVARNPKKLSRGVRIVTVDLAAADPAALESAVEGADAVLSGLGPRSSSDVGVAWQGTRAIVQAMKATNVRRIVVVSAAPIGTVASPGRPKPPKHDVGDGFFMRNLFSPLIKAALGKHYADLALMEDILRDSGLDWTIVRPPRLTDKPLTGTYRTAYGQNLRRGLFISRADVAHLMLRVLGQPETIRQTIGIAY